MSQNTTTRIFQGLMKVTFQDKRYKWFRISRRNFSDLVNYWQTQPSFYYAKIYEIRNYKKTKKGSYPNHEVGSQIGYITLRGSLLSPFGVYESSASHDYKTKHKK